MIDDLGGDPACWAHLFGERNDITTRHDVHDLVVRFYRAAAMDDLLGPVFAAAHVDWPGHIDPVTGFWMWQVFGVRGYEGSPLRAHEPVDANAGHAGTLRSLARALHRDRPRAARGRRRRDAPRPRGVRAAGAGARPGPPLRVPAGAEV